MIAPLLLSAALLHSGAGDPRLAMHAYAPDAIVAVDTRPGFETTVQFGDDEHVENIAIGDSAAWQVTPNRRANLVFVKPATAKAPATNMTVVTDRRTYLFALHVSARAQYLVRFAYPAAPVEAAPKPTPTAPAPQADQRSMAEKLNFAWKSSGDKSLLPAMIFDDGHAIYLAWPEGHPLPAILQTAPDGKGQGPVNTSQSGPFTVVQGIHDALMLQSGKKVAQLVNLAPPTLPEPPSPEAITPITAPSEAPRP